MSARSTLLLLAIALGLGAYAYYVERPAQERESAKQTLLDLDREAVQAMTLTYPDRELALRKSADGSWRLTAPIDAPADQQVVKNLLGAIADAELSKTITDPGTDLAPYGLDKPEVTIHLELEEGTPPPPTLLVGKQTPIGFKAYVRKDGDPALYLTTGAFYSGVKKETKDLRDKTIIEFADADVHGITLARNGAAPIHLQQTDGAWKITEPTVYPADAAEVRSLLSSLSGLRAQDFVDGATADDLVTYGLTPPALEVTVSVGDDGTEKGVRLGGEAPGTPKRVYAMRPSQDTVFLVGDWSLKNLDKDLAKLRDRTVLSFDPEAVGTVVITRRGEPPLTLHRGEGGAWTIPGAEGTVDAEDVKRFLDDLRQTRPDEIVSDEAGDFATYGLQDPDLHIALTGPDGTPIGAVLASRAPAPGGADSADATGDKFYFAREGVPTVYEGRAYQFTRLAKGKSDFLTTAAASDAAADDSAPAPE